MPNENSSAPLKTAEGAATLWCVHVTGADDVHPMPSREVALEEANALNTSICRIKRQDVDPVLIAVVAEWPHSADSHAAGLMIRNECLRMRGERAAAAQAPAAVAVPDERAAFEQAFIAEKLRVTDCDESDPAVQAIRICHLQRYGNGDYASLEAYFAWFAWQARAALATTQQAATESVLIDGVAYDLPEPVAHELLRLHIELLQLTQPAPAGEYPALPEPAMPASAGVCCGNLTAGAQYMGQTEMLCCGERDEAYPGHYSTDQMRAYADATHAMRAGPESVPGPQAETLEEAARDVGKWLNERPNRPIDLRHVAMLCAHASGAMRAGEQEPAAWPKDAKDVRAFFSADFITAQFASEDQAPCDEDRYTISAHDFLSAVNWWADFPHVPRDTSPVATQGEQDAIKARRYDYLRETDRYFSDAKDGAIYVRQVTITAGVITGSTILTDEELDESIDAVLSATTPPVATTKDDDQ